MPRLMPTYFAAYCWKRSPITQTNPPSINQKITERACCNSCHRGAAPEYARANDPIMPNSPKVKNVTNDRGFMPVRYALRYGMYIVPQSTPAPSAAHTPFIEWPEEFCADEAMASSAPPKHRTAVPPNTPAHRRQPAWHNSLKNRKPQRMPIKLLEFHKGNAMLKPTSRMAKTVSVFATAHRQPASTAQNTRGGARRTSAPPDEEPTNQ